MEIIPTFNSPIQAFLGNVIINAPYIFLDYWSFVHLSSGLALGAIFRLKYSGGLPWLVVLGLLIAYEIFEIFLVGIIFTAEGLADVAWDLIVGMIGYSIAYYSISAWRRR